MKRILAVVVCTVGFLAGSASPTPASEVKKFEGTIAVPSGPLSNELAAMDDFCPTGGDLNGTSYRFFDLGAEYKYFYVSGPALMVDQPEPTGVKGGNYQDYDVDLYVFNSKCVEVDGDGPINRQMGVGDFTAARPVRYAAVNYYAGPYPNIPIVLEASNAKIKKK